MSNLYNPRLYILPLDAGLTLVPGYTAGPCLEAIPVPATDGVLGSFGYTAQLLRLATGTEVTLQIDRPSEWPDYVPLAEFPRPPAWLVQLGRDRAAYQVEAWLIRLNPAARVQLMALVEKHTCMRVSHHPSGAFKLEFKPATSHEMRPVEITRDELLQFFSAEAEA